MFAKTYFFADDRSTIKLTLNLFRSQICLCPQFSQKYIRLDYFRALPWLGMVSEKLPFFQILFQKMKKN